MSVNVLSFLIGLYSKGFTVPSSIYLNVNGEYYLLTERNVSVCESVSDGVTIVHVTWDDPCDDITMRTVMRDFLNGKLKVCDDSQQALNSVDVLKYLVLI